MIAMTVRTLIKPSQYHDSVSLMLVARELSAFEGIQDAAVVMATEANKSILADADLLSDQARKASANDLVIAVKGEDAAAADQALNFVEELLEKRTETPESGLFNPKTIRGAIASYPEANVAVISVPGRYAADQAWEALLQGLHVLLFSDNVPIEDELALKRYARKFGLLLMGPGAGTAILNNIALGFANAVPAGPVGIVAAAGTGLQEVSVLLARYGTGISQGIGVGGRDLSIEVGGIMTLEALKALQDDPATQVIVLISKPPDDKVAALVLEQVRKSHKPTVVCFPGSELDPTEYAPNAISANTLQEAAMQGAIAIGENAPAILKMVGAENERIETISGELRSRHGEEPRYLRGLFSGGTLCYEAQLIWKEMMVTPLYSNAPLPGGLTLPDSTRSQKHTAVDLGEEEFTVGRPHPMIDNDLRVRRLFQEARDPQVGVILMDVVLGYGAHPDPASELCPAVEEATELARREGRGLIVVASVTGTDGDPQGYHRTKSALERAGLIVCDSNASAARLAGMLVSGDD